MTGSKPQPQQPKPAPSTPAPYPQTIIITEQRGLTEIDREKRRVDA